MDAETITKDLNAAGLMLLLVDGQLAVKEESLRGASEKTRNSLTLNRAQIKALLLDQEAQEVKPYIDDAYNMGEGGKGCLVIPFHSAERYKYWVAEFTCFSVESEEWFKSSNNLKEADKLKWKPFTVSKILADLGASKEVTDRYCHNA